MGRWMQDWMKRGSVILMVAMVLVGGLTSGACQTDEGGGTTDGLVEQTPTAN